MNERQSAVASYLADRSQTNRDALIAAHMYLCKRGARKFRRPESEGADLEQVAAIGLLKATDTYRAERTTPFEAYAWIVMVGELMHYVRDFENAIRIPRWLRSLDRCYVQAWEILAARQHAEPTAQQLADALGVSLDAVEQLQALRRGSASETDSRGGNRFDTMATPSRGISVDERLTLIMAVEELTERERVIVLGTYGAGLSQAEVARLVGLSQSQVSKLLARALGKLSEKVA
jgi:RNA polymerase sigma-B factor